MSGIHIETNELFAELETSLDGAASAVVAIVRQVRRRLAAAQEKVEQRRSTCQGEIEHWSDRIHYADEEEDTAPYYHQLQLWNERMDGVRRSRRQLEQADREFEQVAIQLLSLAEDRTPKARQFLRRRMEEIEHYFALKANAGTGFDSSRGDISTPSRAPLAARTGYHRMAPDPRDWRWSVLYGSVPPDLPERLGLESFVGPAQDQKSAPHCVCYALAALKHHDEFRVSERWLQFSPGAIYLQCKRADGKPDEDGTTIRDAFKVAVAQGLRGDDGNLYYVRGYARLESAQEICHALSLGKVVLLGVQIDSPAISALERDSLVPMPDHTDGGHCMTVVGYDSTSSLFRVRNSWGTGWADVGHCWLPFGYLDLEQPLDAWTSVCERVQPETVFSEQPEPEMSRREIYPGSNYAWFDPADVLLEGDDGPDLKWNGISQEYAEQTLHVLARMRPYLNLATLRPENVSDVKNELAQLRDGQGNAIFTDGDLGVLPLYFGGDAVRIDTDGNGGFLVINGRHRLWAARQAGVRSVAVSISNPARKQLGERIKGEK